MPYNPFNKSIGTQLDNSDLAELVNQKVSEGYYVEYKGDIFPSNEKIGRSIAALANTNGGWYIVDLFHKCCLTTETFSAHQ